MSLSPPQNPPSRKSSTSRTRPPSRNRPASHSRAASKTRHTSLTRQHRSSTSVSKTEILINVYDLLPPGKLSSVLWLLGSSLLHTGVVIRDREYAYGGHDRPNTSGVYWTKPRMEPPGGTFRLEILHGFTLRSPLEIDGIIKEVSGKFLGMDYNLLHNNCNHFTSHLVQRLTGRAASGWLNRAASIGVALPCMVPNEWVNPPDAETQEGELLLEGNQENDDDDDERAAMLSHESSRSGHGLRSERLIKGEIGRKFQAPTKNNGRAFDDTEGRGLPASERAPQSM